MFIQPAKPIPLLQGAAQRRVYPTQNPLYRYDYKQNTGQVFLQLGQRDLVDTTTAFQAVKQGRYNPINQNPVYKLLNCLSVQASDLEDNNQLIAIINQEIMGK